MSGVVKNLDAAMKSMKLEQKSALMDKIELQFEDLEERFVLQLRQLGRRQDETESNTNCLIGGYHP